MVSNLADAAEYVCREWFDEVLIVLPAVVAAALGDNVQRLGLGLALLSQDPVVVAALDIAVLLDFREVRVRHAQLLTLIMVPATAVT